MKKIDRNNFIAYFIFSQLFIFGYFFQLFGLLTITETNMIVAAEMLLFMLFMSKTNQRPLMAYHIWLFILFVYIIFNYIFISDVTISEFVGYELFVIYPTIVLLFLVNIFSENRNSYDSVRRFLPILIVIQLPVMVLQTIGSPFIMTLAKVPLYPIDMVSGTFFLKSDATLVLFSQLYAASILFKKNKPTYFELVILVCATIIVFLANSAAGLLTYIFLIIAYVMSKAWRSRYRVLIFSIFVMLAIFIIDAIFYEIRSFTSETFEYYSRSGDSYRTGESYSRDALIGFLFSNDLILFGNGLFDYYNYVTKEWKFYAGHSLLFSIYNDTGIVGIAILLMFFWFLIHKSIRATFMGVIYYALLIVFSFFNVLLYDLGALVMVVFFVRIAPSFSSAISQPCNIILPNIVKNEI